MKSIFLSTALLLVIFVSVTSADSALCQICAPYFIIPPTWEDAQFFLKMGCDQLTHGAATPCKGLVNAADLTSSWPNMYPHLVNLKNIGCKKLCPSFGH